MSKPSRKKFAMVPIRAASDKELGGAALRVLIILAQYADKKGTCFPKQKTIANELGVSRQAVFQSIKKLKQRGYIKSEQQFRDDGSYGACLYTILYSEKCKAGLSTPESSSLHPLKDPDLSTPESSGACTINRPLNTPSNKPTEESPGYWFAGEVIRLNKDDFINLYKIYAGWEDETERPSLVGKLANDFDDWLSNRDKWYNTQAIHYRQNWFMATFAAARKLHNQPERKETSCHQ